MKIILLSTGRGLRKEVILEMRAKLGLRASDVLCLVSWHPPRNPLPVDRHLVLGPQFRVAGNLATVHRVQRRPELFAAADQKRLTVSATDAASQTAGSQTNAASPGDAARAPGAAGAMTHLPVFNPRRLRKAITWRVRRLKKAARTHAPSGLAVVRSHPLFRKVRNGWTPSVSLGFATNCLWSSKVHAMTRDADLVVALDAASQRGAWTLAQRVQGPDVVIGIPAARQLLDQREVSSPG